MPEFELSVEIKVLVQLALNKRVDKLPDGFHFQTFLKQVEHHRVEPFLVGKLDVLKPILNADDFQRLKLHLTKGIPLQLRYIKELRDLLKKFQEEGVRIMPFKGPLLSHELFGNYTARSFKDLDVWVEKKDFETAHNIMCDLGYEPLYFDPTSLSGWRRKACFRVEKDWTYIHKFSGCIVELHWRLFTSPKMTSLTFNDFWNNAKSVSFLGLNVKSFNDEHLLFYLVVHGSWTGYNRLKWLFDFHYMLEKSIDGINWEKLLIRARELGCERAFLLSMKVRGVMFKESLPMVINSDFDAKKTNRALVEILLNNIVSVDNPQEFRNRHLYRYSLYPNRFAYLLMTLEHSLIKPEKWTNLAKKAD